MPSFQATATVLGLLLILGALASGLAQLKNSGGRFSVQVADGF